MADLPRVVVPSATVTASGNGAAIAVREEADRTLSLLLNVTAATGTLDLTLQWSHDGTTFAGAQPADTFAQVAAVTAAVKTFTIKAPFYRVNPVLGGTAPSFTYSISEYAI